MAQAFEPKTESIWKVTRGGEVLYESEASKRASTKKVRDIAVSPEAPRLIAELEAEEAKKKKAIGVTQLYDISTSPATPEAAAVAAYLGETASLSDRASFERAVNIALNVGADPRIITAQLMKEGVSQQTAQGLASRASGALIEVEPAYKGPEVISGETGKRYRWAVSAGAIKATRRLIPGLKGSELRREAPTKIAEWYGKEYGAPIEPYESAAYRQQIKDKILDLTAQANRIATERSAILNPTGARRYDLRKAWDSLSPEESERLQVGVQEEINLRGQANTLGYYSKLMTRKAPPSPAAYHKFGIAVSGLPMMKERAEAVEIPIEVKVAAEDILMGTGLPVQYKTEGCFYDLEKIAANPKMSAKFEGQVSGGAEILGNYRAQQAYIMSQEAVAQASQQASAEKTLAHYYTPPIIFPGQAGFGVKGISEGGYNLPAILATGTAAEIAAAKLLFKPEDIKAAQAQVYGEQERQRWVSSAQAITAQKVVPSAPLRVTSYRPIYEGGTVGAGGIVGWEATLSSGEVKRFGSEKELISYRKSIEVTPGKWERFATFMAGGGGEPYKSPWGMFTSPEAQLIGLGLGAGAISAGIVAPTRIGQVAVQGIKVATKWGAISMATTGAGAMIAGAVTKPKAVDAKLYAVNPTKVGTAEAQAPILPFAKAGGEVDVERMMKAYGEEKTTAILAQAGLKPTIERGIWEQLPPETQQYYAPTERVALEYQAGITGVYGRGVEYLKVPATYLATRQGLAKWPGRIATGTYQYFVPHVVVSELYPTKGALAAITLVPHFGPTWGYTGLTWKEQPWYGKAMGIGFGAMPFLVGPMGSAFGKVSAKAPALGRVASRFGRVVTAVPSGISEAINLQAWAPWRGAYAVSGLAGQMGLAGTKFGPLGAKWGWWSSKIVPLGRMVPKARIEAALEKAPPFEKVGITEAELAEALKGPKPLTAAELQEALYGKTPLMVETPTKFVPSAESIRFGQQLGFGVQYGETGGGYIPGVAQPPAIVQQVQAPTFLQQFQAALPRVATIATYAAPIFGATLLPIVAPTMFAQVAPTAVQQNINVVNQMAQQNQITQTQQQQVVQQLQQIQQQQQIQQITQQQAQQQVQNVLEQRLTVQQQQIVQQATQQQVVRQQQTRIQQVAQQQLQQVVQQTQIQQIVQQQIQQTQFQQTVQQLFQPPTTPPIKPPVVPPVIIPPWVRIPMSLGGGGVGGLYGGVRLTYLGEWEMRPEFTGTHPLTGKVVKVGGKRRIRYGAVAPRIRLSRITGNNEYSYSGKYYKPEVAA